MGIATCAQPQCWTLFRALLDAQGQASDAESAYARVDVGEAPVSLKFLEAERQMIQIRAPGTRCPIFLNQMQDPVVSNRRKLKQTSVSKIVIGTKITKTGPLVEDWQNITVWRWLHYRPGLFLFVYVDDVENGGKTKRPITNVGHHSTQDGF